MTAAQSHPAASLAQRIKRPMSRDKADTLLLLFSCALVLAPHIEHAPPWIMLVSALLLVWRGWITFRGNRMPPAWLLVPTAALAMSGVYVTHQVLFGREAGVSMLVLLLAFKLLEMRAKRDLFVVLFLSFFLMLTHFFYSQTMGTALMMVAAVIAILTTQLSFQYTGAVPSLKRRLLLGATIFGLSIPLTLVLFLLFPRVQGPLWGLPGDAQSGRTGLSENMAPGNISNLAQSGDIAFRVKFIDAPPARSNLYWRGPVLGRYDGRTWNRVRFQGNLQEKITLRPHGAPVRHQITLEPNGKRWLFALETPAEAPALDKNPVRLGTDLQLLAAFSINERVRYDAVSYPDTEIQPDQPPPFIRDWLDLPDGFNPQTLAFAARLRSQSAGPDHMANAVLRFFREEKFRYTLQPPLLGKDTVDEFLFSTRAGFCEHYASAFVVLMRAAGVPARVVTGYQGGEINAVDGFMTIRQSDAHAWAEIWLENRGWTRVDPTAAVAPDRIQENLANVIPPTILGGLVTLDGGKDSWLSKLRGLRHNWDAVTNAWNQWVLNYNPEKQRSFIQSLGFKNVDWQTLTGLMFAMGVLVSAVVVFPLLRSRAKIDPVDALYLKLCRQMARRGCPREPHEGPRSYGLRLAAGDSPLPPEKRSAANRFLALYEAVRYGPDRPAQRETITKLKTLLAECR